MDYDTQRRNRNGNHRRQSRSRSRSRSRERSREHGYRNRGRERSHRGGGNNNNNDNDLYRDIINDDYQDDKNYNSRGSGCGDDDSRDKYYNDRQRDKMRDDRDYDKNDRNKDRHSSSRHYRHNTPEQYYSDQSDENFQYQYDSKNPSHIIIVLRLQKHITEADIRSALIQQNMLAVVRLVRERATGVSRGFAFVEFNTVEEAVLWMELNQGVLNLGDVKGELQYSYSRVRDWYCLRCGIYNFRRREKCFRCYALREESSSFVGADGGGNEVSNILTKKIMLRNLDALTNEEGVLTAIQQHVPDLAKKISKVLVSRDSLTQTSRGICYLHFESLVDSMNLHNALVGLEPPLKIDNREVRISYCVDHENRQIVPKKPNSDTPTSNAGSSGSLGESNSGTSLSGQYTIADVPRLAEYSASLYATTPEEHAHYRKYYTEYYISEINKGHQSSLPNVSQLTEANSGAAVALSAIQRKQKKMNSIETTATAAAQAAAQAAAAVKAGMAAQMQQPVSTPKGNDGKIYPTPDVSLYQYDETSGYYYDPTTGLYYDAHSQYYYNNETGAYLYWDQRKMTYVLATPAAAAATVQNVVKETAQDASLSGSNANSPDDDNKKDKNNGNKQDKVKVAKKIVKDMEKWAKQLNQKKDYIAIATPQPILTTKADINEGSIITKASNNASSYADVGFSILEKKDRTKVVADFMTNSNATSNVAPGNKLLAAYGGGSDSDDDHSRISSETPKTGGSAALAAGSDANEKDYVDFQKLTCLLCKRAFQSLEILQKHLKISNLHKENLQKYNLTRGLNDSQSDSASASTLSYRDRAKERRLKYGESDPPPPNRIRECFENEIKSLTSKVPDPPNLPIADSNVGNRLLQKMGWSEGQGLGRQNQGRTNIVEVVARSSKTGLGNRGGMGPNDDYKTYIRKMMKSRYESV